MALPGLSTLGMKFAYGVEATAGTIPTSFAQLTRITSIGGLSLEVEQIDVSAIEDYITRYVAGRADTGGSMPIGVNLTEETTAEWDKVIEDYQTASASGKSLWFEVWHPKMAKAFFFVAEPPTDIPIPSVEGNAAFTVEMNLTVNEYKGRINKVDPVAIELG